VGGNLRLLLPQAFVEPGLRGSDELAPVASPCCDRKASIQGAHDIGCDRVKIHRLPAFSGLSFRRSLREMGIGSPKRLESATPGFSGGCFLFFIPFFLTP